MASRFTIWTDLRVRGTGLTKEVNKADRSFMKLQGRVKGVGTSLRTIFAAGGIFTGIAALGTGVRTVTDQFIDLDHAITGAGARWGPQFQRGQQGFNDLSNSARQVASDTEFMAGETAKGLDFFARAGLSAATAMELLPGVADFATAANFDFAESADIATDALGALGMNAGTTEQKVASFTKITDQAAKTANMANMDVGMWFETLKKVGPASVAAGQDMKQLNAAMAILSGSGIKAETAGVNLRMMLNKLADPTAKGRKALKKLGVTIKDEKGNFKDLSVIIGDMKKGAEKLGEVKKAQLMARIFGVRQVSAVKVLFDAGRKGIEDFAEQIEASDGYVKQLATTMRGSLQNRLKKVKSQMAELGMKAFDVFGPRLEAGIQTASDWLANADTNSASWLRTIEDVADVLGVTVKYIYENKEMVLALIKAYMGFKAAGIITDVIGGMTSGFAGLTAEIGGSKGAVKGLQGALQQVNAGAIGLTIGVAIGHALWQVLEARAKQRESRRLKKQNKLEKLQQGVGGRTGAEVYSTISSLSGQIDRITKGRGVEGLDPTNPYQANAYIEANKVKQVLDKYIAERNKRLETAAGGGKGMFADPFAFSQLPQSGGGPGQFGNATVMNPSFDIFVTNQIDRDGNTTSSVDVQPKRPALPAPNPVGVTP